MKHFIITVLGILIGLMYWVEKIVCFPIDLILWLLSKIYMKMYLSTPEGYFSVLPNNEEELKTYCKKAEEQVKKCGCEKCQRVLETSKLMKEMMFPVIKDVAQEKVEETVNEKHEEVKCLDCGTVCKFNYDTRVYECPKCNVL